MELGGRLRKLRQGAGLTQKQLGEPRYSHAFISSVEAGRRRPSRAALEHFATRLGVDPEELATGRPPDLEASLLLRLHDARIAISAGRTEEARIDLDTAGREAKKFELPSIEAKAEELSGLALERSGRLDAAIERYDAALELLRGDSTLARVDAISSKARCVRQRGDTSYGIHLLESTLMRLEEEGLTDPSALLRLHASLVPAYFTAGLYSLANESAERALLLAPRVPEPARLAAMHVNVARVLIHRGSIEEAEEAQQRAADLYRQADLETEIGRAHLARGYTLARDARLEEAIEHLKEALSIFVRTDSVLDEARCIDELARVQRLLGQIKPAAELLRRAMALLGDSHVGELALAHRELALCLMEDDETQAEKELRIAIELYERAEDVVQLAATYRVLGDLLRDRGDEDGGHAAYRAGILALEKRL